MSTLQVYSGTILNTSVSNSSINFTFDTNLSNITIEPDYIVLKGINFTNNSNHYTCQDINFSTANSILKNKNFNCTIQTLNNAELISGNNGGSSYYFYEKNRLSKTDFLELEIRLKGDDSEEIEIVNEKGMGIEKIIINPRNYLEGDIKISKIDKLSSLCNSSIFLKNKLIYEILQINSSIDQKDLEKVSLIVNIDKNWMNKNNISKIQAVKCYPHFEEISSSYIQEENKTLYNLTSESFSNWLIFGEKKSIPQTQENTSKEGINNENKEIYLEEKNGFQENERNGPFFNFFENFWLLITAIGLLTILILFIIFSNKKRK